MKSADLNFTDVTTAALVAGREAVIATTAGELEELFSRADALGLVVCLGTDVSRSLKTTSASSAARWSECWWPASTTRSRARSTARPSTRR